MRVYIIGVIDENGLVTPKSDKVYKTYGWARNAREVYKRFHPDEDVKVLTNRGEWYEESR